MARFSVMVQWSEEDSAYIATAPELPGLSAFGSSHEEAMKELSIAQEAYLEVLEEDGEEIPDPDIYKPFSGQTRVRLPKSLHASLNYQARKEGVSLNTYIVLLLSERNALRQVKDTIYGLENRVHNFMLYSASEKPTVFAVSTTAESLRPQSYIPPIIWQKGEK